MSAYDKALIEGWEVLAKYFKTEKIIKATNGAEILCVSFRKALVPVDKILMYARGKVRGVEELVKLEKELAELKNLRQTARKNFDKNPANADKIKKIKNDIKNIINSLNNKKGLEKAGLADNELGNKQLFEYVLAIANKNKSKIKEGEWLITVFKGPKGRVTVMTAWVKNSKGQWYLKTIKIF